MRESLDWQRREFVEYDVERDGTARERLRTIAGEVRTVPVLVEDGKVVEVGWRGRGCAIA